MKPPKPQPFNLESAQRFTIPRERREKPNRPLHPDSYGYSENVRLWTLHRRQADAFREQYGLQPYPYDTLTESN